MRRGNARASTPTAVASVGATAAPSTQAGPQARPRACATAATAAAVATTSAVLVITTVRRLLRISRSEVVRLSQYSSAGRNSSSTTSGGNCARRIVGTKPISTPIATSTSAGATGNRRASAPPSSNATPRTTTSTKPSMALILADAAAACVSQAQRRRAAPRGRPERRQPAGCAAVPPRLTAFASATTTSWKVRIVAAVICRVVHDHVRARLDGGDRGLRHVEAGLRDGARAQRVGHDEAVEVQGPDEFPVDGHHRQARGQTGQAGHDRRSTPSPPARRRGCRQGTAAVRLFAASTTATCTQSHSRCSCSRRPDPGSASARAGPHLAAAPAGRRRRRPTPRPVRPPNERHPSGSSGPGATSRPSTSTTGARSVSTPSAAIRCATAATCLLILRGVQCRPISRAHGSSPTRSAIR